VILGIVWHVWAEAVNCPSIVAVETDCLTEWLLTTAKYIRPKDTQGNPHTGGDLFRRYMSYPHTWDI
jgi:hypothetical protein